MAYISITTKHKLRFFTSDRSLTILDQKQRLQIIETRDT
jgi:hypothetical protein